MGCCRHCVLLDDSNGAIRQPCLALLMSFVLLKAIKSYFC